MDSQRLNNLTVARFVAALMVYVHHSSAAEYQSMPADFFRNVANNGHVGVSFFFVLSGFVLAASNLERLSTFGFTSTLSFYWKRGARIIPLWLVASAPFIIKALQESDPRLLPYLTFTQAWSGNVTVSFALLAVAWTLSVEVFFYLVFPFVAAAVSSFRGKWLGPSLIAIGLLIPTAAALYYEFRPELASLAPSNPDSSHRWLYRSPLIRLGEFIAGIGGFVLVARWNLWRSQAAWLGMLLFAAVSLILTMGLQDKTPLIRVMPYAAMFVLVVIALAHLERLGAGITWRIPILLGEASFAFYLIHQYYFKLTLQPPLVEAFGLSVAQTAVLLAAICTSVGLHLMIEVPARTILLRALHIRSSMPGARVVEDRARR